MNEMNKKYMKIQAAWDSVEATGYGIVTPGVDELTLEEPVIIKQSGKYGIKLRAVAPSVHMMKTNICTEITPIVGSEQQSEELVSYLLNEFEEDPTKIWESNIFGKSLNELVNEGLHNKLYRMPEDARKKLQEHEHPTLGVLSTNTRAISLYKRMGWRLDGVLTTYDPAQGAPFAVYCEELRMRYRG